ncbi:RNA-binding domain-containing protein [Acaromyces ingoldii]|uniref:RNA-binding domain-containing protein n=1 Tax=Acaromyces ingoldii TaxID=215250 RepID=A0A316YRT5_9BASI|nr:RNA-binding domain-containing protein [Acaromyces ingoldii]PWN91378.1 RNA-binding domain-containing protein [Acaromyces ingoldii]
MGREGDVDFANGSERNRRDDREESPAERDGMDVEMDGDEEASSSVRRKGRGFDPRGGAGPDPMSSDGVRSGKFDLLDSSSGTSGDRAARSIEGWIVLVTNIHEEASEEEVTDKLSDYGAVKNCHLNLDRRTGYLKGYALVEYTTYEEATAVIEACKEGLTLMDKPLKADFAFVRPPALAGRGAGGRGDRGGPRRERSRSPARR